MNYSRMKEILTALAYYQQTPFQRGTRTEKQKNTSIYKDSLQERTRSSLTIAVMLRSRASICYHIIECKFSVEFTLEPLRFCDHYL